MQTDAYKKLVWLLLFKGFTNLDRDYQFLYTVRKVAKLTRSRFSDELAEWYRKDHNAVGRQRTTTKNKGWYGVKADATLNLLDKDLTHAELRVFLYLCAKVTKFGLVEIDRADAIKRSHVARTRFAECLTALSRKGLIVRDGDNPNKVRVEPALAYFGEHEGWSRAIDDFSRAVTRQRVPDYPDAEMLLSEMIDQEAT